MSMGARTGGGARVLSIAGEDGEPVNDGRGVVGGEGGGMSGGEGKSAKRGKIRRAAVSAE